MSYCCALCRKATPCNTEKQEGLPNNCPCHETDIVEWSKEKFMEEDNKRIADAAIKTEYEGYCQRTRVEEIMEFAASLGIKHIGIAHCIGLKKEAGLAYKIFTANGFEVDAVGCKAATFSKKELGQGQYQINKGFEGTCNPIAQAKLLENAGCELAVIMGLCVGHDTLFIKHCNLPVTYLVVKDRVLGHNPVQALYMSESYMHDKLFPPTRRTGNIKDSAD